MSLRISFILVIFIIFLFLPVKAGYASSRSGGRSALLAHIKEKGFIRIFGYTSPNSYVQAAGIRTFAQVPADKTGYFLINNLPVSEETLEICLVTLDSERRAGFPLCIPITEDTDAEIGPLLLSPTVSLTAGSIVQNQKGKFLGKTVPNAKVAISFFDSKSTIVGEILKPVLAFDLPIIETASNAKGEFESDLPANQPSNFHVFAKGFYENNPTLKSQTLSFSVISFAENFLWRMIPWLVLLIFIILVLCCLYYYEKRTKKISGYIRFIYERKLLPLVAIRHLLFRRLLYNLQDFVRKHQK